MKVKIENFPRNAESAYVLYEGTKKPELIKSDKGSVMDLETMLKIVEADALEFDMVRIGSFYYYVVCDSMGRIRDRAPTAIDKDKNTVLVGTLIFMPSNALDFAECTLKNLYSNTKVATITGRFSDKDISDIENIYVMTDVKVFEDREVANIKEAQSLPRKKSRKERMWRK